MSNMSHVVDFESCPIGTQDFINSCKDAFYSEGVLMLEGFLTEEAVKDLVAEAEDRKELAHYTSATHNVYLTPYQDHLAEDHIQNRQVSSSKGCITTDQIPTTSGLRTIYDSDVFRKFVCSVVSVPELYEYADPLSSINVHYANEGQELNWHFDNSEFAITLLLQSPQGGGSFDYVKDLRSAEVGDMNHEEVEAYVDGLREPTSLSVEPGTLMLFSGRNSMHRVTPTIGDQTRILVVLAYNSEPDISLSEEARMTFYGRLG
jgi:hypothetical protein